MLATAQSLGGLAAGAGVEQRSWIKIGQIRTLSAKRLGARLARASDEELARVVEGLNEIIS